ncbi:capsid protein [robinz virus RP_493]|uniref:Capsid protein n=1 Tax=robinz virus RP_493 TaxID=2886398 RepID=A0A8K1UFD4_9CIRC|nr:capsid protein [robinz virus RP_493]UDN67409.1 capsid protein [robinz virus RP_493]
MRRRRVRSRKTIKRRRVSYRNKRRRLSIRRPRSRAGNVCVFLTKDNTIDPTALTIPFYYQGIYNLNDFYNEKGPPVFSQHFSYFKILWIRETLRPQFNCVQNLQITSLSPAPGSSGSHDASTAPVINAPFHRSLRSVPLSPQDIRSLAHSKSYSPGRIASRKFKPAIQMNVQTFAGSDFAVLKFSPKMDSVDGTTTNHLCSIWFIPTNNGNILSPLTDGANLYTLHVTAKVVYQDFTTVNI